MVARQPKTYTAEPGDLVSNSLTWEKVRTWDVGFDYGFFNNRLTGSFELLHSLYRRHGGTCS